MHITLAAEFAVELKKYGRIYMYRFMPDYKIKARHIEDFPYKTKQAAAIQMMISNNLDHCIAQHPEELITYGGNVSYALEAAEKYFLEEEIIVNVCVLSSVKPIDIEFVTNSVQECGRVIILEEGNLVGGWGAEVSSIIHENSFNSLKLPVQRLGSMDFPIPSSGPMEQDMLPSPQKLYEVFKIMK